MDNPVTFVNNLILEATAKNSSDIHLEPQKDCLLVRLRIDGFLRTKEKISKDLESLIISRIKIMAGLDIAEKRIGQDGRIYFNQNGSSYDLRISTLPTIYGEKVVIRILPQEKNFFSLKEIGLAQNYNKVLELVKRPEGLILITGPTGSGKTTTLYAILKEIATSQKNTITIEDPVEYTLEGLNQVQVNYKAGLTFATGLRWILRQDPDIIMVGEIRDTETARLAVGASLTGHLVLATLHTNSSAEAISRLIEMGIEPFLLAPALKGVISQRLIRMLCNQCKEKNDLAFSEKNFFNNFLSETPEITYHARGCPECDYSGYSGRTGIFEILKISEKVKKAILNNNPIIFEETIKNEIVSLHQAGFEKIKEGITSLEEIERVISLN